MRSLATYLHKHQGDTFSGTARANLALAIDAHRARAAGCAEALIVLLECALKMPEKLFNEGHKAKFLRWLSECEAAAAAAAAATAAAGAAGSGAPVHRLLEVADADASADEVCLLEEDGAAHEGAVRVAAAGGVRALAAALAAAAARGGVLLARLTAAGEVVGWEEQQ